MCGAVHPNGRYRCSATHPCGRHSIEIPQTGMYRHTIVISWPGSAPCPPADYSNVILWP